MLWGWSSLMPNSFFKQINVELKLRTKLNRNCKFRVYRLSTGYNWCLVKNIYWTEVRLRRSFRPWFEGRVRWSTKEKIGQCYLGSPLKLDREILFCMGDRKKNKRKLFSCSSSNFPPTNHRLICMAGENTCLTDSAISGPIPSPGKRVALISSLGDADVEKNDCAKGAKPQFVSWPAVFPLRSFSSAIDLIQIIYYPETKFLTSGGGRELKQRKAPG